MSFRGTTPESNTFCGEGVTRTSDPGAKLIPVNVYFKNTKPMKCLIKARDNEQALQFARARHANATGFSIVSQSELITELSQVSS